MAVHQGSPQWLWTVGLGESIAFQLLVKPECILQAACSTDWEECRRFMPGNPPYAALVRSARDRGLQAVNSCLWSGQPKTHVSQMVTSCR